MTNRDLLEKIHDENKAINRNIQRLVNIGLLGLFRRMGQKAKENNDETGRRISKAGLWIVAITEVLTFIGDVIDYKES